MTTSDITIPAVYRDLFFFLDPTAPRYRYYDYEGGRSSGKSTTIALALALEASLTPLRVLCAREYQNSLKASVKQLLLDLIGKYQLPGYENTVDEIRNRNGSVFYFKGLHEDPETTLKSIEGIDRCWVEEAQFITDRSIDILLPTIRKTGSTVIFSRNPLTPRDVIAQRFETGANNEVAARTVHKHTTFRDLDQAGLLNQEIRRQISESHDQPTYAHIWEGQPLADNGNNLIRWEDLIAAERRPPQTEGTVVFGVDVARYGADRTVVAVRKGLHLEDIVSWQGESITQSAHNIINLANRHHPDSIHVDDTGVGGGLTDILTENQQPAIGVNYAHRAHQPDKYPSVADELWFDFHDLLPDVSINPRIPNLTDLYNELTTRQWGINSRNQREIQKKQAYKQTQQTGSPDLADALLLAYYNPQTRVNWNVNVI